MTSKTKKFVQDICKVVGHDGTFKCNRCGLWIFHIGSIVQIDSFDNQIKVGDGVYLNNGKIVKGIFNQKIGTVLSSSITSLGEAAIDVVINET